MGELYGHFETTLLKHYLFHKMSLAEEKREQMAKLAQEAGEELLVSGRGIYMDGYNEDGVFKPEMVSKLIWGSGDPGTATVMLVGAYPGQRENRSGVPFTGQAGKHLDTLLKDVDLDRSMFYITNVLKLVRNTTQRRSATEDEMHDHGKWLIEQIKIIRPRIIMALGNDALRFLGWYFTHGNFNPPTDALEDGLKVRLNNGKPREITGHGVTFTLIPGYNPTMYRQQSERKRVAKAYDTLRECIKVDDQRLDGFMRLETKDSSFDHTKKKQENLERTIVNRYNSIEVMTARAWVYIYKDVSIGPWVFV